MSGDSLKVSLLDKAKWITQVRRDTELTDAAFRLASLVCDLVNPAKGFCYAGQAYLAEHGATTERAVRNHLKALVEGGHIAVKRRGRAGASHYFLVQKDGAATDTPNDHDRNGGAGHSDDEQADNRNGGAGQRPVGTDYDRNGSVVMTGTAVPPSKIKNKRSCFAPLSRRAGKREQVSQDEDSPTPPADLAAVAQSRALDARWAEAVGPDLAKELGSTDLLHRAIAAGEFIAEDVDAGIADWLRRGTSAPRKWIFFEGWAEKAAARRKAGTDGAGRLASVPREAVADRGAEVPADSVRLEGGVVRTRLQIASEVERWHRGEAWNQMLGFPPDSEFTTVPAEMRGPRRYRQDGAAQPAQIVV